MTDPEQDDVFEAYLQRQPVLPPLDDKLDPPAALDEKVLAQAREAIQPQAVTDGDGGNVTSLGAVKRPMQRPPRWAVPVALAATILLCLSVVMNISLNRNRPSPNLERMSAARADVRASALANATAESDASAGLSAHDALATNAGEARESVSGGIPSREVIIPRAKVAGAPAPHAPVVADASAEARDRQFKRSLAETDTPSAPQPSALGSMASANSAAPAAPMVQGGAQLRDEASDGRTDSSAADKAAAPHPADPKVWLQQIDALRAAGKADQADAEMRRFKAAFPHYAAHPATTPAPDLPK